ncbi:MAG: signal peptidase I [Elainellaceae cyanobacterium]
MGESEPVGSAVDKPAKSKARKGEPENVWVEFRNTLLLSAVIALGIRHFVFEARYIPTGSMLPTLEINDRLIIEKMSYRFREPTRGDVVVFAAPDSIKEKDPTFNDALIKRIVGLPGETIEVKEGKVFVDGEAIVENYINEVPNYVWGPQSVPEDSYLVLGDNRNNSYDSHFWGFLPDDNLIGRAAVRVWPPGRFGAIDEQPAYYFEAESEGGLAEPAE